MILTSSGEPPASPGPMMAGAEPRSWDGDRNGVLVLHGFTGTPGSVMSLAEACAGAGWTVDVPLLPGHGTGVADMMDTRFDDWLGSAAAALEGLEQRCDRVVVMGLSMGGSLAIMLAHANPHLAGMVCVNPAVIDLPEMSEGVDAMLAAGVELMPGTGSDIADPSQAEIAYEETPLAPLRSLLQAAADRPFDLGDVKVPLLLMSSRQDHVVAPEHSEHLARHYGGLVDHLWLARSFHVATNDYDRHLVAATAVAYATDRFSALG
ncbi:MAG: alpha/beta fold hydrolase [Microthrixaceae bacterium]